MVEVERHSWRLRPDPRRVVTRYFRPGEVERILPVVERVLALPPAEAESRLHSVLNRFAGRHRNITRVLSDHCVQALEEASLVGALADLTETQRLLIGAYFTMEYALEAVALFNPSIVAAPDQTGVPKGILKVILSFRALGEGHMSSITFREGVLDGQGRLTLVTPRHPIVDLPEKVVRHRYEKEPFLAKMREIGVPEEVLAAAVASLKDPFLYGELLTFLGGLAVRPELRKDLERVRWLARSHYEVTFSLDTSVAERVILPVSQSEAKGVEDLRLVRFEDADRPVYYGTYTAYDGQAVLPNLLETPDFYRFTMTPLHGPHLRNKGLALFPRKVGGRYVMLARIDGVNNYLLRSDDLRFWPEEAKLIQSPSEPWEFVQIGNCGSPIETPEGWLLLTHGVGPMREYSIGAVLLDLDDPSRVIGRLRQPLLSPTEEEREGYVPNVVYSCGAIVHAGLLVIPYGISDTTSGYATVALEDLLRELRRSPP